ncbi:MAG: ACP S-malonyltransferase [Lachnospiraceae bacterium]|nr:ACP S-malonyltransferase [Lachnospiraceae bacterium]
MKTAFLYAGQGSQHTGMGKDLYDDFPEFRQVFDNAELDFDLKEMCFENPKDRLNQTQYTQPCMVAFACGITNILKSKNILPDVVAGLSLGEYSALYASGVWNEKDTIQMVAFRGKAMTEAAKDVDAAMSAIMGLSKDALDQCVQEASGDGIVSICNDNCPGQIVIGGEKKAVEKAANLAKEKGAKRCVSLNVSGPFHTSYMKKAGDELRGYFKNVEFHKPKIPVIYNVIGREKNNTETIQHLLEQQVQNGVLMRESIDYMLDQGVKRFVEIGPGKALTGFVKRCAKEKDMKDIELISLETSADIETFLMGKQ